jgi:peptidyl-dipeptidase A
LEAGFSRNWQDLLKDVTGTNNLDASAIKEYFQPLTEYLTELRQKEGYPIGWSNTAFEEFYEPTSK